MAYGVRNNIGASLVMGLLLFEGIGKDLDEISGNAWLLSYN